MFLDVCHGRGLSADLAQEALLRLLREPLAEVAEAAAAGVGAYFAQGGQARAVLAGNIVRALFFALAVQSEELVETGLNQALQSDMPPTKADSSFAICTQIFVHAQIGEARPTVNQTTHYP